MPEQITKYPDVTLQVLKGAGARCGEGLEPRILTRCPPERFCALPGGELCVYGIEEIPKMTQIRPGDLARVVCPPGSDPTPPLFLDPDALSGLHVWLLAGALVAGALLGRLSRRGPARYETLR
jgi:hypothetical protein